MIKQSSSGEWAVVRNSKRTMALDCEEAGKKSHLRIAHDGIAAVAKYSVFLDIMYETRVAIMRDTHGLRKKSHQGTHLWVIM